ncbi:sensor histidine kinase [Nakamurella deserti]|uniref:sensor histidine kinase n=1 Tax=Nakamurella deserti TaxID=2164074 RepID=UPI0014789AF3|nr:sensor histidine kinase [Nakamurella deserti]
MNAPPSARASVTERRLSVGGRLRMFWGVALLVLLLIAAGAVLASRALARDQALQDAERMTDRLGRLVIAPLLGDALTGDVARRVELDRTVANRIADGYLAEVTVWTVDGTVVYASDAADVGMQVDTPVEVAAAITQDVRSADFAEEREAATQDHGPSGSGYVEVYVPLAVAGQPKLAFEAYYDYGRVNEMANSILRSLLPLVLIPLVMLQLIQVPIAVSLARRVKRHESERAALLERSLTGSEKERIRIAADLHDGPIQDLAGIGYALGAVRVSAAEAQQPVLSTVQDSVHRAIDSLRRMMVDLYPPDLNAAQLPATIADLTVPLRDSGIAVDVQFDDEPMPELDPSTVTALYRVAREALANVAEHSRATAVTVRLAVDTGGDGSGDGGTIVLSVTDNGVGIDVGDLDRRGEGHLGLRLLRDRVESLGGTFAIGPAGDTGTRVSAALPWGGGTAAATS